MDNLLSTVEKKYLKKDKLAARIGDTIKVELLVKEGSRERIQVFEGILIAVDGSGLSQTLTVRKISYGVGVEKILPFHSPSLKGIKVVKEGKPRRAKLYYLRDRIGKAAMLVKTRQKVKANVKKKKAKPNESAVPVTSEEKSPELESNKEISPPSSSEKKE